MITQSLDDESSVSSLVSYIKGLPSQEFGIEISYLVHSAENVPGSSLTEYLNQTVSLAFQTIGNRIHREAQEKKVDIGTTAFPKLINCLIVCCREKAVSSIVPLLVFSNCFETTPIDECEQLWKVFVSFRKEFASSLFISGDQTNTNLSILAIVNSLLKRASRMRYSSFRGDLMLSCSVGNGT